jgi:NADH-quinone oxidoreductase subunit N
MLFLPELTLLGAGLVIFLVSLGKPDSGTVKNITIGLGVLTLSLIHISEPTRRS